jgi:hypothetical protein
MVDENKFAYWLREEKQSNMQRKGKVVQEIPPRQSSGDI